MRFFSCGCLLLSLVLMVGCGGWGISDRSIVVLSHDQMVKAMTSPRTVIVDVRTPGAYRQGHLPGAVNIPLPELHAADPRLENAKKVIVYAAGGSDVLAAAGVKKLLAENMDQEKVSEYRGGVALWRHHQLSLSGSGSPTTQPTE